MITAYFIICWFFYEKLRGLDHRGNFEHLWAGIYAFAIFITLILHPTISNFFFLGKSYVSPAEVAAGILNPINLPFFYSLLVSVILGALFYYTVRLPGFMTGGRMLGLLIAVPGVFINNIVAYILIGMMI